MAFQVGHKLSVGRRNPVAPRISTEAMNLNLKKDVSRHFKEMYLKQIERAKTGNLPSFIYLIDRVLGKPVESFKIAQVVKLVMGPED